jgi:hypothetical protein
VEDKQVWRSIKFPEKLVLEIENIARRERRSFSAQALLIIEREVKKASSGTSRGEKRG